MFPTKTSADKKQDGGETESTTYLEPGRAGSLGTGWARLAGRIMLGPDKSLAPLSWPGPGNPGIVGRSLWSSKKALHNRQHTGNRFNKHCTALYFVRHEMGQI